MAEVPGPVVVVCRGHRCHGLQRLSGSDLVSSLRPTVRGTAGGVLLTLDCPGRCDLAALVLLGWRGDPGWVPLAGMQEPHRVRALVDWLPGPDVAAALRGGPQWPDQLRAAHAETRPPPTV